MRGRGGELERILNAFVKGQVGRMAWVVAFIGGEITIAHLMHAVRGFGAYLLGRKDKARWP